MSNDKPGAVAPIGLLLMAYGTPEKAEQVEQYFTQIRGGRKPSPAAVANLQERYARVGGSTPLLAITQATRSALEMLLNTDGAPLYRVYAGMKHWHPFIADVLAQMAADGVRDLVAVALAPHYSRLSIGGYWQAVEAGAEALGQPFRTMKLVEQWHLQPEFLDLIAEQIRSATLQFPATVRGRIKVVFSAHSLPERIRTWDDPYEAQLLASCGAVADRLGLTDWRFAWQSAGHTGEPWLGPDILDYLERLAAEGIQHVLQVPIGFVSDHLEVLYDIDIEAKERAATLGIQLARIAMPNATPAFIRTLAAIVAANDPRVATGAGSPATVVLQPA